MRVFYAAGHSSKEPKVCRVSNKTIFKTVEASFAGMASTTVLPLLLSL